MTQQPLRKMKPPRGWLRAKAVKDRSRPGTRAYTKAVQTMRRWEERWLGKR